MKRRDEKGQALVETAIVTPLFIFMLLGVLQMALVYHASYLLKYAAYRAARTGAMLHANHDAMRESAVAVLLPVMSAGRLDRKLLSYSTQNIQGGIGKVDNAVRFAARFMELKNSDKLNVVICGPTKRHMSLKDKPAKVGSEVEFDEKASYQWSGSGFNAVDSFERTKLRVQLQLYFDLKVPFANYIIYRIWQGKQIAALMRMGGRQGLVGALSDQKTTGPNDVGNGHRYVLNPDELSKTKDCILTSCIYYLPIHENYPFRMQSNLYPDKEGFELPANNQCWHYPDGASGTL